MKKIVLLALLALAPSAALAGGTPPGPQATPPVTVFISQVYGQPGTPPVRVQVPEYAGESFTFTID